MNIDDADDGEVLAHIIHSDRPAPFLATVKSHLTGGLGDSDNSNKNSCISYNSNMTFMEHNAKESVIESNTVQ